MDRFIKTCNSWAGKSKPFLFIIDFECRKPLIISLESALNKGFLYEISGTGNTENIHGDASGRVSLELFPVDKETYRSAFELVTDNIIRGNSYLLNLTFPTRIETNLSLSEIYQRSRASYKLYKRDDFLVFSPECFIKISDGHIYSYPMKGTIEASVESAEEILLNSEKELWEHNTIVDLIRNDLSMVSKDVEVTRFRYIDRIKTNRGELLQVSSEIRGRLNESWKSHFGEILSTLLPAGSISGAPKRKTVEIIKEAEQCDRGYFTGIFGIFDGEKVDSGVMIRYIEHRENRLQFRSGGGITGHSEMESEYNEMVGKVYVPIS